ncbi:hypothetical protein [Moraxella lacunata]|uniref:Uncharacterized protein n=1 Tax=Moraxella lacunata TaxID=477 RepID=A0A1V4H3L1_MORLA|nr:hypothetical protein [Moraxella lacunata]OPH39504.1 hypothetical protein B5J94_00180 [Moraxella lacunata]
MAYICAELDETSANGDGFAYSGGNVVHCKTWVVSQSPLNDLAITGSQSLELSFTIASLLMIVKAYKIARKSLNSI